MGDAAVAGVERLDDFLKITGSEILDHPGTITHQQAIGRSVREYEKYKELHKNDLCEAERHFVPQIEEKAKNLERRKVS